MGEVHYQTETKRKSFHVDLILINGLDTCRLGESVDLETTLAYVCACCSVLVCVSGNVYVCVSLLTCNCMGFSFIKHLIL